MFEVHMKKGIRFILICSIVTIIIACTKTDDGTSGNTNNNNTNNNTSSTNPSPITPVWDANAWRGVWVTTTASTALDSKDNITQTVANCKKAGINQIFVVVYNNARTIYPSNVLGAITGIKQLEKFVGRDPLQEMIDAGHAAGIKVHAWFEYGFSSSYSANGGAIINAKPEWAALDQNGKLVAPSLNFTDERHGFLIRHGMIQQHSIQHHAIARPQHGNGCFRIRSKNCPPARTRGKGRHQPLLGARWHDAGCCAAGSCHVG